MCTTASGHLGPAGRTGIRGGTGGRAAAPARGGAARRGRRAGRRGRRSGPPARRRSTPGRPSHARAAQLAAPSASGTPSRVQRRDLVRDPAVPDAAARVRARVDRHPGLGGAPDDVARAGVQRAHVRGVGREAVRAVRDAREVVDVDQRGDQRGAARGPSRRSGRRSARCRARCSRSPRRSARAARRVPNTCAVTRAPAACADLDRRGQHVVGPQRGEVADRPVDPVAHQLDPAVAGARPARATASGSSAGSSSSRPRPGM